MVRPSRDTEVEKEGCWGRGGGGAVELVTGWERGKALLWQHNRKEFLFFRFLLVCWFVSVVD